MINGLLALIGISIALYAYFSFPLPTETAHHGLDKFGRPLEPENTLLYLFVFPCFQMWLVVMPLWGGWRSTHVSADEQARRDNAVVRMRKLLPWVRPAEPCLELNRSVLIVLVIAQVGILIATIFRAVSAAFGITS
jgi:hypothetical protein